MHARARVHAQHATKSLGGPVCNLGPSCNPLVFLPLALRPFDALPSSPPVPQQRSRSTT